MKNIAITQNHLYRKTYQRGKHCAAKCVTVYVLKDTHAHLLKKANPLKQTLNRVGISVPKKFGSAVERNRAKRIVREAYRLVEKEDGIRKGFLVVLAIRDGIKGKKTTDVIPELRRAFEKLDMKLR